MFRIALPAAAILLTLVGCSGIASPTVTACSGVGPPGPATVTGCWIQLGVDTYAELALVQQGTAVNGSFSYCGAVQGCTTRYAVTGTAVFPFVVLRWTEWGEVAGKPQRYDVTFDARVTGDTLAGRMATNGQSGPTTSSFGRAPAP